MVFLFGFWFVSLTYNVLCHLRKISLRLPMATGPRVMLERQRICHLTPFVLRCHQTSLNQVQRLGVHPAAPQAEAEEQTLCHTPAD